MDVNPLQRKLSAQDIAPERLAGNSRLTQEQKVTEASRQFESVLLKQILSDSQKTVIKSEFSDNSTPAGIYQDLITQTLADNISKSGAFGLAKTFEQQLNRPAAKAGSDPAATALSVSTVRPAAARPPLHAAARSQTVPLIHPLVPHPVTPP